jgi:hypothetical protein
VVEASLACLKLEVLSTTDFSWEMLWSEFSLLSVCLPDTVTLDQDNTMANDAHDISNDEWELIHKDERTVSVESMQSSRSQLSLLSETTMEIISK